MVVMVGSVGCGGDVVGGCGGDVGGGGGGVGRWQW